MVRRIYAAVLTNSEGKIIGLPVAASSMDELEEAIANLYPGGVFKDSFGKEESGTVSVHDVIYTGPIEKEEVNDISTPSRKKPRTTSARKRLSAS